MQVSNHVTHCQPLHLLLHCCRFLRRHIFHLQMPWNCIEGYVKKHGTSTLIKCEPEDGVGKWQLPLIPLKCIREYFLLVNPGHILVTKHRKCLQQPLLWIWWAQQSICQLLQQNHRFVYHVYNIYTGKLETSEKDWTKNRALGDTTGDRQFQPGTFIWRGKLRMLLSDWWTDSELDLLNHIMYVINISQDRKI